MNVVSVKNLLPMIGGIRRRRCRHFAGELWRQRKLMSPLYTPRGVQAYADILLALLAQRFAPRLVDGLEPQWTMQGTLGTANGIPMVIERLQ